MRVTGGTLRGRQIKVPREGTRPTQDRVREALFSILAERLPGSRFLDLFAGSGAVGIDAWSRGADAVGWIESDSRAGAVLKENVATLCGDERGVLIGDVFRLLEQGVDGMPFDLVFADPPYAHDSIEVLLDVLGHDQRLARGGMLIVEREDDGGEIAREGWRLAAAKRYGKTRLYFLERD
jgi:16S rRNA (guanine966-N2)-methyltransferase